MSAARVQKGAKHLTKCLTEREQGNIPAKLPTINMYSS